MTALVIAASGVPNPVGWAVDQVKGWVGGAAERGFQAIIGGLTTWMLDAVAWVAGGVFNFFLDATDPNVQADWFVRDRGPYATTAAVGAALLVGFLLIGVTQGVLAGDVGGMLRRVGVELPVAVLGMVGLVTVTQVLIRLTDELSHGLLDQFADDVHRFTGAVGSVAGLTGGAATGFVVFLFALVCVLAGIVLVAELAVRSALIYIVVALAPLVFAAQLWPALRGAGRKLLELLVALIVSKLVVAVALAVAAAAAAGAGAGTTTAALAPPEAAQQSGSPTAAVGILLAAAAAFGVAAFSPLLVARLLPLAEAAGVASGIRGGPARAGQQAMSMGYYAQMSGGRSRLTAMAASPTAGPTAAAPVAAGGGSAAAAGSAGAAAAGPAAAAVVATKTATGAARTGARAATDVAANANPPPSPTPASGEATRRPRPTRKEGDHGQPA